MDPMRTLMDLERVQNHVMRWKNSSGTCTIEGIVRGWRLTADHNAYGFPNSPVPEIQIEGMYGYFNLYEMEDLGHYALRPTTKKEESTITQGGSRL